MQCLPTSRACERGDNILYMRIPPMVVATLLALSSAPLQALDVKTYRESVGQDDAKRAVAEMIYITGVGEGLTWANVQLNALGRERLYCAPAKPGLSLANYKDILDRHIAEEAKRRTEEELDQLNIESLLLQGLIEAFPCAGKEIALANSRSRMAASSRVSK